MYILTDEPSGGTLSEAFSALDNAFGTEEFAEGQAITVISNSLELNAEEARGVFNMLVRGEHVSEV